MNIFVGNLPYTTSENELREMFERYGEVSSARIIEDRETRRSRGFGFVEMDDDKAGEEAVRNLDGSDFHGRPLKVNEARPREDRGGGGGGGGGGGRPPRRY